MGINPTVQLSKALGDIDALQTAIANYEQRMDAAITGKSRESETEIRVMLTRLRAALGQARNQEAFWREQVASNNQDRKAQGDLARA